MRPLISVIIPIYNVEKYIERCLNSVLNNTYHELEVVCVNDGSEDNSMSILRSFEEKDPRLIVVDQANSGVSSARNAGLRTATGEFVSFIDPDDDIHPCYFETLLYAQSVTNADYIIGSFCRIKETDQAITNALLSMDKLLIQELDINSFFLNHDYRTYVWGRLLRLKYATSVFFDETLSIGEDSIYNADLWGFHPNLKACSVNAPIYYYVQREKSAMAESNESDLLKIVKIRVSRLDGKELTDKVYLLPAIRHALTVRYLTTHIHPNRDLAKESYSVLKRLSQKLFLTGTTSKKNKLLHLAMIYVPGLYWLYRARQPGMWKWEKSERNKRRRLAREKEY